MQINFTEFELETISAALDDYICYDNELETIVAALDDYVNYHDENAAPDELIGGIPVIERVDSIQDKIEKFFTLNRG